MLQGFVLIGLKS